MPNILKYLLNYMELLEVWGLIKLHETPFPN